MQPKIHQQDTKIYNSINAFWSRFGNIHEKIYTSQAKLKRTFVHTLKNIQYCYGDMTEQLSFNTDAFTCS